ncbi:MAG TPA: hypothetical protein VFV43_11175 [Limnobacter sp.]|nr:hypothetical protein [Limnobacter sp.]
MEITLSPQVVGRRVNALAFAKNEADIAKAKYDELKAQFIADFGDGVFKSATALVTIKPASRPVLDQTAAKGFLTAGQLAQCITTSYYTDVRIKYL